MSQDLRMLSQSQGSNVSEDFRKNYLSFLSRCAREFGEVVPVQLDDGLYCVLTNPEHIMAILTNRLLFTKADDFRSMQDLLGNGLLLSEGSFWLRQRRLTQPVFHSERIRGYGETMVAYTQKMLQMWHQDELHNVHQDMMRLTLNIVMKTLFNQDLTDQDVRNIAQVIETGVNWVVKKRVAAAIGKPVPDSAETHYQQAIALFVKTLDRMIDQRRQAGLTGNDLLSLLMQVEDADAGSRMTNQQLRDEAATLIMAGHETTSNTLTRTWYLLEQNPEVRSKLQAELLTVLAGRLPTVEDLPKLTYASQVIKETMRLYPTVVDMKRKTVQDCEIGGYFIPRGTTLIASQWVMHRDPRYFDAPEVFIPDRWAGDLENRLPRGVYFPFGDGPRVCIGKSFAQMEAVLILATIAQQFNLELVPHQNIQVYPYLTLHPREGLHVMVRKVASP
ncbi:MAG: cytochrome P450 [Cyanobacteria bacterium P01_F01_bin.116]